MNRLKSIIKRALQSTFISYTIRALTGFLVGYIILISFPQYDLFWMLLSIILVISPEEQDARKLTFERVVSNLIGSLSGLVGVLFDWVTAIKIPFAVILAIVLCRLFNLMKVVRSAVVAVLIILIEHKEDIYSPFERFFSVLVGCLIGLLVTVLMTYLMKKLRDVLFTNN